MLRDNDVFKDYMFKKPFFEASKKPKMRRVNHRYKINHEFKYSYNDTESKCSILNISEGGMFLKVPQILEIDDKIRLFFEGENTSFDIFGKIVHIDNNYVGVSYVDDDLYDHSYVRQYVNEVRIL